jgi:abhydrolase domain-containing protein 11
LSKFWVATAKAVKLSHIFIKGDNPAVKTNLMIFHGMYGSKTNFRSIVTAVKSKINSAYLLDLRNHGQSEHSSTMSYEECALDIKNFIDSH